MGQSWVGGVVPRCEGGWVADVYVVRTFDFRHLGGAGAGWFAGGLRVVVGLEG